MTTFITEPPTAAPASLPTPPSPLAYSDTSAEPSAHLYRPFGYTLRRHRLLLLAVLSLIMSVVFWIAPRLGRTYDLSGSMKISLQAFEPMPELSQLPAAALKAFNKPNDLHAKLTGTGPYTLELSTSAPAHHTAYMQLHSFSEDFTAFLGRQAQDTLFNYRTRLAKEQDRLAARDEDLTRQLESFRVTHPGILPDDPNSIAAKYEKLNTRLEDKQQRQRLVSQQLTRLKEYKRTAASKGAPAAPPPTPLPPPAQDAPAAANSKPDNDPEVVALSAQLQLVNDQIDEQLRTRTEQHPYVVDLRTQQSNLQKKLDAAKQRAASGAPAPATVKPLSPARPGIDPSLAAAQEVDLQIESLQSEKDALDGEIASLTSQRDAIKTQVDQVMPARRELDRLTKDLDTTKKDRQTTATQLDQFDRRFGKSDDAVAIPSTLTLKDSLVEISPLTLAEASTLPSFPRLPLIYGTGLLIGFAAAAGLAKFLQRSDRSFHHPQEAAAVLGIPVLGAVSEIRTPGQRHMRGLWKSLFRPLVMAALLLVMIGSAIQCYRHLADPGFATSSRFLASWGSNITPYAHADAR